MHFIGFLIIGLIAGYIAERIMRGRGAGLIINLIVGIIGAYIGGWLVGILGLHLARNNRVFDHCCHRRSRPFVYSGTI